MEATLFERDEAAPSTAATLRLVQDAGEDFEWYPTTERMVAAVASRLPDDVKSIMDIGAGDGRVLGMLSDHIRRAYADRTAAQFGQYRRDQLSAEELRRGREHCRQEAYARHHGPELFAIEKSAVLAQRWPENITPVGTDVFEQNLACLPVDYIFCNPPYSQFETWAANVIESGFAKKAFLVIPRRWKESRQIADALKRRGATASVIHQDDFSNADRRARAVIDIVEVSYPRDEESYRNEVKDPFDIWFDQNIDTFDRAEEVSDAENDRRDLARINKLETIGDMVDAYNEEYARMEENYRAIFKLDHALLKELGVEKTGVRDGIKKKMAGLKTKYWGVLFERLDTITKRLSTETKERFLRKITGRATIAFTLNNAYTVVLWAIQHANRYYDEQLVKLFRDLSTFDGVLNYKSNQRTWDKDQWRFKDDMHGNDTKRQASHYALDYRIVLERHQAIVDGDSYARWDSPGGLYKGCHETIDDVTAVLYNLGFAVETSYPSRMRGWRSGAWQDFHMADGSILFQVKAYKNGNLHFRFKPDAIRALNVEAARLLGWIKSPADVVAEMGYSPEEAASYFGSTHKIGPSSVKLLSA